MTDHTIYRYREQGLPAVSGTRVANRISSGRGWSRDEENRGYARF
jgi:hypothetical protein